MADDAAPSGIGEAAAPLAGAKRAAADEPSARKRATAPAPGADAVKVVFEQTQSLRTLVDVINNILTRVTIKVVKDAAFEGIQIECIDPKQVCLVAAKLRCSVPICPEGGAELCVVTSVLNTCLKAVAQHYSLDIESGVESAPAGDGAPAVAAAELVMRAYESISNNYWTTFRVPTLHLESDPVQMSKLTYEYTIEMDLITLRNIVKHTLALHGKEITLMIEEPLAKHNYQYTVFTISTDGDAQQQHQFHSVTEDRGAGGTCVIRTEEEGVELPRVADLTCKMCESFSAEYLNYFLKSMERHVITMRITKTTASRPQRALVVTYPLGSDESHVCLMLAPRAKLDE